MMDKKENTTKQKPYYMSKHFLTAIIIYKGCVITILTSDVNKISFQIIFFVLNLAWVLASYLVSILYLSKKYIIKIWFF